MDTLAHTVVTHDRPRRLAALAVAFFFAIATAVFVVQTQPAEAHATGTVKTCDRDNNNTWDAGCTPAVFAVCKPGSLPTCSKPRDVDVKVSGFTPGNTIEVWWITGELTAEY